MARTHLQLGSLLLDRGLEAGQAKSHLEQVHYAASSLSLLHISYSVATPTSSIQSAMPNLPISSYLLHLTLLSFYLLICSSCTPPRTSCCQAWYISQPLAAIDEVKFEAASLLAKAYLQVHAFYRVDLCKSAETGHCTALHCTALQLQVQENNHSGAVQVLAAATELSPATGKLRYWKFSVKYKLPKGTASTVRP